MDPRWDEEAMLKRELAKLHTGEEWRLIKRMDDQLGTKWKSRKYK